MHKFRASSLGLIMTDPKGKDETLSVGAKTQIESLAKQLVYGYDETISSKYLDKGIAVEDDSIALYNSVFFTNYRKNTERKTNDWITGECDIFAFDKVIDIKSPWSLATFPCTSAAGQDNRYEWQGRAYMMLWDVAEFEIAYCLVNTPDDLIGFEREELHIVDHITPDLRITRVHYKRDKALEDKIKFKVDAANNYLDLMVKQIADEHTY
jgi:hypothetical protein